MFCIRKVKSMVFARKLVYASCVKVVRFTGKDLKTTEVAVFYMVQKVKLRIDVICVHIFTVLSFSVGDDFFRSSVNET